MKLYALTLFVLLSACQNQSTTSDETLASNDTITTTSGLKYYFIKKGEGRQIEDGAKVTAYNKLFLSGSDTVFWSTDDSEDSAMNFVQGKTSLIDGALELYPLLREGDEVVAIMHPDIAYGDNDRNGLPGGSTLTFNPIIIKAVSEPKKMLSDTLYQVAQNGNAEDVMSTYESINTTGQSRDFHMELSLIGPLMNNLVKDGKNELLEALAVKFEEIATKKDDKETFRYYVVLSAERQKDIDKAIAYLTGFLADDPDNSYFQDKLSGLQKLKLSQNQ